MFSITVLDYKELFLQKIDIDPTSLCERGTNKHIFLLFLS